MRVDGAVGPLALGAKGSACDRLTPYRRVEGSRPRELYSIAALARYGAFGAIFYTAFGGENHTTALTGEEMQSPFGGASHQRGKSHRRWLIDVMLFMPYDTESQSRNADFISIAAERQSATLSGRAAVAP